MGEIAAHRADGGALNEPSRDSGCALPRANCLPPTTALRPSSPRGGGCWQGNLDSLQQPCRDIGLTGPKVHRLRTGEDFAHSFRGRGDAGFPRLAFPQGCCPHAAPQREDQRVIRKTTSAATSMAPMVPHLAMLMKPV